MSSQDTVREEFLREAAAQDILVTSTLPDGRLVVEVDGAKLLVDLDHLARKAAHDQDGAAVRSFVAALRPRRPDLPAWPAAKAFVRVCAEPADQDFGEALNLRVTRSVHQVLVYSEPDESKITWLTANHLRLWDVSTSEAWGTARANLAALLAATPVRVETLGEMKLGMLETSSPFKASLLLSPNLKQVIASKVGWPVYAAIPCRDFIYLFSAQELVARVGPAVVKEHEESGYPISTEVLEVSDAGIKAVGSYTPTIPPMS